MDEQRARALLKDYLRPDGSLSDGASGLRWNAGAWHIMLDGKFTVDTLEAIVWWMRHMRGEHHPGE